MYRHASHLDYVVHLIDLICVFSFICYLQDDKHVQHDVPRALKLSEMSGIVQSYVAAAKRAKQASFDFIELHCANGYLLDTFLQSCSNKRTDAYGGSYENRFRLLREVIEGILTVVPANRVCVRLSPNGTFNDMVSTIKDYITRQYGAIVHFDFDNIIMQYSDRK
jgi:2,4-dienoyl-CoA reductase-like NADH-dependent reductase (Old Yellow Enzyme family)